MSDSSDILAYLQRYPGWNNAIKIMQDLRPGQIAWALRSRVSDLRRKGHIIDSRIGSNGMAEYKYAGFSLVSQSVSHGIKDTPQDEGSIPSTPNNFKYEDNGQMLWV